MHLSLKNDPTSTPDRSIRLIKSLKTLKAWLVFYKRKIGYLIKSDWHILKKWDLFQKKAWNNVHMWNGYYKRILLLIWLGIAFVLLLIQWNLAALLWWPKPGFFVISRKVLFQDWDELVVEIRLGYEMIYDFACSMVSE